MKNIDMIDKNKYGKLVFIKLFNIYLFLSFFNYLALQ